MSKPVHPRKCCLSGGASRIRTGEKTLQRSQFPTSLTPRVCNYYPIFVFLIIILQLSYLIFYFLMHCHYVEAIDNLQDERLFLYFKLKWSPWSGSNRRPTHYKCVALPLRHTGKKCGGDSEIRTRDSFYTVDAFKASALDHSAKSP